MAKKMKKTTDRAKAMKMKKTTDRAKAMKMKKTTDRAKAWKCVRFNDKKGFRTKFNKTNFPNEWRKEMYYYSVKCVEQGMRGFSPTSVAMKKKFQKFQKVPEGLKLEFSPDGFQFLTHEEKREAVEKLVDEFGHELAAAISREPVQGVNIQVDSSDNLQVGAGSAHQLDMTVREDVPVQRFPEDSEDSKMVLSPADFRAFKRNEKRKKVEEFRMNPVNEFAAPKSHGPVQGVNIQADFSDNLQVGAGSARQLDMTVREDVPVQEKDCFEIPRLFPTLDSDPFEIPVGEIRAVDANPDFGNILSNDASLQNDEWNQWDDSQGRPSFRIRLPVDDLVLTLSDIKRRSLGFPGRLPKFEWSEEAFRSYINLLESMEDAVLEDVSKHVFKMPFLPMYGLLDSSAYEDPQNVTGMPEKLADESWINFLNSSCRPEASGTSPNLYTARACNIP